MMRFASPAGAPASGVQVAGGCGGGGDLVVPALESLKQAGIDEQVAIAAGLVGLGAHPPGQLTRAGVQVDGQVRSGQVAGERADHGGRIAPPARIVGHSRADSMPIARLTRSIQAKCVIVNAPAPFRRPDSGMRNITCILQQPPGPLAAENRHIPVIEPAGVDALPAQRSPWDCGDIRGRAWRTGPYIFFPAAVRRINAKRFRYVPVFCCYSSRKQEHIAGLAPVAGTHVPAVASVATMTQRTWPGALPKS
jgi:hypothetical protein